MRKFGIWLLVSGIAGSGLYACGSDSAPENNTFGDAGLPDGSVVGDESDPFNHGEKKLLSIAISPASAAIEILNGAIVTQAFSVVGTYSDGSSQAIPGATWSADSPVVGAIDSNGLYTPSGAQGGLVAIKASYSTFKATGSLAVKVHDALNPGNVPGGTQSQLKATATPDAKTTWTYPYDKTVFPRGLLAVPLMWNGGGANDAYYIHLSSPYYELEVFTNAAPPSRYTLTGADWTKFVNSTSGATSVAVNRFDGTSATVVANHTWTIANGAARGTVYYWSNNLGRVLRIKPGAAAPDDFLAAAKVTGTCSTCHTVSADGSTLVIGGDVSASTFDLKGNQTVLSGKGRGWAQPALTPEGKYLVENNTSLPGPMGGSDGMFETATGARVPNSGLDGRKLGMPAFSPDGTKLAYRGEPGGPTPGSLRIMDFDAKNVKVSNDLELITAGNNAAIAQIGFPSMSPDSKWIIYSRGTTLDTRYGTDDLYLASATVPGQEIRLASVNGDAYPFAAGARDLSWNYEPTFAPVAAGGYFWVVFTSRRTYGNLLTGAKTSVKQLWVTAIDQNPQPNTDPSHPAFHLQGQDEANLAMRGFWALDPCKGDGQGCASGTECCGGYCDQAPDGGGAVCGQKMGCSNSGDKCDTSADCCGVSTGTTCINHVCSEPPPN